MNHIGTQLNKLQSDLNNEIRLRIDEVNDITEKIAKLNVKIMSAGGQQATAQMTITMREICWWIGFPPS